MSLISLILVLAVVGVIVWLINTYVPIAQPFKTVINVVVIIVLCLWLLQIFGIVGPTVPRVGG